MEFASKFAYDYGYQGSDNESFSSGSDVDNSKANSSPKVKKEKRKTKIRIRKADSNIIAVKFNQLVMPNEMFAGEPIKCKNCQAIMTKLSKKSVNDKIWTCEFCATKNVLSNVTNDQEIPDHDDVTFLLEPAPPVKESTKGDQKAPNKDNLDSNYLMYCVDISGSMDTCIETRTEPVESSPMSRLTGVKTACLESLKSLKEDAPNKRVALVTFSEEVKFFGDCSKLGRHGSALLDTGNRRQSDRPRLVALTRTTGRPKSNIAKLQKFFTSFSFKQKYSQKSSNSPNETEHDEENEASQAQQISNDILTNREKM
jgi:hypothetical protein